MFDPQVSHVLFEKHGLHLVTENTRLLYCIHNALRNQAELSGIHALVEEIVRTSGDLSTHINPKYKFNQRFEDLDRCLMLDGYFIRERRLIPLDPSIEDERPIEDDLVQEISASNLDEDCAIRGKLNDSAEAFRRIPPDLNACLTNARVAMEELAKRVASRRFPMDPVPYDSTKWGSVIGYLRERDFFSIEEEKGLAGVYRFLSPGAHRPIGITEDQSCRLGRSLALSMSWYLVKRYIV